MAKPKASDEPAAARERVVLHTGGDGIAVVADPAKFGAHVRFGELKVGVEYVVAPAEAGRLIVNKRFDPVDPAHKQAALHAFRPATKAEG